MLLWLLAGISQSCCLKRGCISKKFRDQTSQQLIDQLSSKNQSKLNRSQQRNRLKKYLRLKSFKTPVPVSNITLKRMKKEKTSQRSKRMNRRNRLKKPNQIRIKALINSMSTSNPLLSLSVIRISLKTTGKDLHQRNRSSSRLKKQNKRLCSQYQSDISQRVKVTPVHLPETVAQIAVKVKFLN